MGVPGHANFLRFEPEWPIKLFPLSNAAKVSKVFTLQYKSWLTKIMNLWGILKLSSTVILSFCPFSVHHFSTSPFLLFFCHCYISFNTFFPLFFSHFIFFQLFYACAFLFISLIKFLIFLSWKINLFSRGASDSVSLFWPFFVLHLSLYFLSSFQWNFSLSSLFLCSLSFTSHLKTPFSLNETRLNVLTCLMYSNPQFSFSCLS